MKYPVKYSYLGFYLNSIVDNGGFVELDIMKSKIDNKIVFQYLKEKFGDELDISLYTRKKLKKLKIIFIICILFLMKEGNLELKKMEFVF